MKLQDPTMLATERQLISATEWMDFVTAHADEHVYYHPAWHALLRDIYGYDIKLLSTRDSQGQLSGIMPIGVVRSILTGTRVVSLPFCDLCAPLATDDASMSDLVGQALAVSECERARYLEIRSGEHHALAAHVALTPSDIYASWTTALSATSGPVWSRLRDPVKRQVKKARRQGVTVRVADSLDDVDAYYALHLLTRSRKHGMPAQPRRYFRALWERLAPLGMARFLLAEHEGKIIAGIVLLTSGKTVRYAYGASDPTHLQLGPNNLLMWEAIDWACQQGYSVFDFGRTARDNTGLMEFKRGWGSEMRVLSYYFNPVAKGLASTSETSWKYQLLTMTWRKLPLAVTGPIGTALYRHLG
ncbi:MAG TPA: GNAT family N-acetyltransferase [Ktedonobacterales bacterium]